MPSTTVRATRRAEPGPVSAIWSQNSLKVAFAKAPAGILRMLTGERRMVSQIFASWNPLMNWLRQVERLRHAA
jgi:hypothetical protein